MSDARVSDDEITRYLTDMFWFRKNVDTSEASTILGFEEARQILLDLQDARKALGAKDAEIERCPMS